MAKADDMINLINKARALPSVDMTESPSANLPNLLFDPNTGEPIEPVGAVNLPNLLVDPNTGEPKEPIDTVNLPNFLIDPNMRLPKTPMTELPFGS